MAVTNDIVRIIAKKTGLAPFRARALTRAITDEITSVLQEGDKIKLNGLGTFKLSRLPSREIETNLGGKKTVIKLSASVLPDFEIDPSLSALLKTPTETAPVTPVESDFKLNNNRSPARNIRFIELTGKVIPKNILQLIPETIARRYQAVPFELKDKTLSVAMTDPENEEAFNLIRKSSGKIVKPYLTTIDEVGSILDQYSSLQSELKDLVDSDESEGVESITETVETGVSEDEVTESSPAAKIVSTLLKRSVREKASDIHIEPAEEDVKVRFRVDGVLRKILALPKEIQSAVTSRIKILANLKIDETRLPQDGRIQILLDGNKVDFRISTIPTVNGEKIVARVLDHSKGVQTYEQLGITGRALAVLKENTSKAHGMTLVTGPTGSGKSTTLYAIISQLKDESVNIITMEDPVEYRMTGVNQCQVNSRIGYTFASGLRSILRQDPDIVLVGEIRDRETADIAINAALTGHIVLSSLHTNDSAGALPRLLDMGIEPFLITSSTNAIVAQRLCRQICDRCREPDEIKPEDSQIINEEIDSLPEEERKQVKNKKTFFRGKGCPACNGTGFKGRIGIYEIMSVTESIRALTIQRATSSQILAQAKKDGLITMKQDGILKALNGQTAIEEVWRVTKD